MVNVNVYNCRSSGCRPSLAIRNLKGGSGFLDYLLSIGCSSVKICIGISVEKGLSPFCPSYEGPTFLSCWGEAIDSSYLGI